MNRDLQRFLFTAKRERSRVDRDLEKNKLRLLVQVTPPTTSYASYYKLRLRLAGRRQILLTPRVTAPDVSGDSPRFQ